MHLFPFFFLRAPLFSKIPIQPEWESVEFSASLVFGFSWFNVVAGTPRTLSFFWFAM